MLWNSLQHIIPVLLHIRHTRDDVLVSLVYSSNSKYVGLATFWMRYGFDSEELTHCLHRDQGFTVETEFSHCVYLDGDNFMCATQNVQNQPFQLPSKAEIEQRKLF